MYDLDLDAVSASHDWYLRIIASVVAVVFTLALWKVYDIAVWFLS